MKRTRNTLLILTTVILLLSCSPVEKSEKERLSEIYSQAIRMYRQGDPIRFCSEDNLSIHSLTDSYRMLEYQDWKTTVRYMPEVEEETWKSLLQVESQHVPISPDLDIGYHYVLVDDVPSSTCTYRFSQVGFNENQDQALVVLTVQYEDFYSGSLYLFKLVDGQWKAKEELLLWIT